MVMKIICLFAVCLVAVGNSFPIWPGFPYYHGSYNYYWGAPYYHGHLGYPYRHHLPYAGVHAGVPSSRLIYYGQFKGSCDGAPDGLYFVDKNSFAYCSNGQKSIQPCAEGSANPPLDHFKSGSYYGFYDFCSINLVAQGYNAAPHKVHPVPHKAVDAGYHDNKDVSKNHYVEEQSYVVEDNKAYQPEHKQPYEAPEKVEGYKETYHEQETYEAPKKAVY